MTMSLDIAIKDFVKSRDVLRKLVSEKFPPGSIVVRTPQMITCVVWHQEAYIPGEVSLMHENGNLWDVKANEIELHAGLVPPWIFRYQQKGFVE